MSRKHEAMSSILIASTRLKAVAFNASAFFYLQSLEKYGIIKVM